MKQERHKITNVVHTELFWSTLESFRNNGNYASIRTKLRELVSNRMRGGDQMPKEEPFILGALKGIWHYHLKKNPNVIVLYSLDQSSMRLHMVTDHTAYAWAGKNKHADYRTRSVIDNSSRADVGSPFWPNPPRWGTAEDIIKNPDLPELSPRVLDLLVEEIQHEALEGTRFMARNRCPLKSAPREVMDAHLNGMVEALALVLDIRTKSYGAHYDSQDNWERFAHPSPWGKSSK